MVYLFDMKREDSIKLIMIFCLYCIDIKEEGTFSNRFAENNWNHSKFKEKKKHSQFGV